MKLAWLTDIHLNFLQKEAREAFYQEIATSQADVILISGDIAEAPSVVMLLNEMASYIQKPIYFVLGNHDYYSGQVAAVRAAMQQLTQENNLLYWLPCSGPQVLTQDTYLVGQDGWADGRLGNYQHSFVILNDSQLIADLFQEYLIGRNQLLAKMQQLADADAQQLKLNLEQAIAKKPKKVMILTHVPPFKESSLYQGEISNDEYLPFYSSKVMGDTLMEVAEQNPTVNFTVFCGHTHNEAVYQPLDNLTVSTGKAEYSKPKIQDIVL